MPCAGICTLCEDDRRKKGIEDGVSRLLDGPLLSEDEGLRGACWGIGGAGAVRFVLELDAVSGRLGARWSGLLESASGSGTDMAGDMGTEPIDDSDASELADAIASVLTAVHASLLGFRTTDGLIGCSSFSFLCERCENDRARGLSVSPADFAAASFIEDCDGELRSFGTEKLHFLEGALCVEPVVGVLTLDEDAHAFPGVRGTAAGSSANGRS